MEVTIESRVVQTIAEQYGVLASEIKPESDLYDDLYGDELDLVEMVMALEDEFAFDISDDDAEAFQTVLDVVAHITKLVSAKAARNLAAA